MMLFLKNQLFPGAAQRVTKVGRRALQTRVQSNWFQHFKTKIR